MIMCSKQRKDWSQLTQSDVLFRIDKQQWFSQWRIRYQQPLTRIIYPAAASELSNSNWISEIESHHFAGEAVICCKEYQTTFSLTFSRTPYVNWSDWKLCSLIPVASIANICLGIENNMFTGNWRSTTVVPGVPLKNCKTGKTLLMLILIP